ncbi:hypothetical protein AAFH68_13550 [Flavobacterium sp. CGRL1]
MRDPKKCIIVDDEPAAHYVLANYIKQNPKLELFFRAITALKQWIILEKIKSI